MTVAVAPTAAAVAALVRAHRFAYHDEATLQAGLAACLAAAGLPVRREVDLGRLGRIDLLVARVGIEVKVAGSLDAVGRQVRRYLLHPDVDEVVLVSTLARHVALPLDSRLVVVTLAAGGL
jgi:hypothetical protein